MFIQVESFVVIKASFAGAALNHYTCTNMSSIYMSVSYEELIKSDKK